MEKEKSADEIRKEAPCYGRRPNWQGETLSGYPIRHEFRDGECIYCGQHQPGGQPRKKRMLPLLKNHE